MNKQKMISNWYSKNKQRLFNTGKKPAPRRLKRQVVWRANLQVLLITSFCFLAFYWTVRGTIWEEAGKFIESQNKDIGSLTKVREDLNDFWETPPVPLQRPPNSLGSLKAAECGSCHKAIYQNWSKTLHGRAAQDRQFLTEMGKDRRLYICWNCHTPLINQQERIVRAVTVNPDDGRKNYSRSLAETNPKFEPELKPDGINCASCHVRNGYVVSTHDNPKAPHPVIRADRKFFLDQCINCHNQQQHINKMLICSFTTGTEWRNGPYSKESDGYKDCISCHMEKLDMPIVAWEKPRPVAGHVWPGLGIAKEPEDQPFFNQYYRPSMAVNIESASAAYEPNEAVNLTINYQNQNAGHSIPTGNVDIFISVDMYVVDSQGRILKSDQVRIGEEWEWWPEAKRLRENKLRPLETRPHKFKYTMPNNSSPLWFVVLVRNTRMTQQTADYLNIDNYPISAVVGRFERALNKAATGRSAPLQIKPFEVSVGAKAKD